MNDSGLVHTIDFKWNLPQVNGGIQPVKLIGP